MKSKFLRIRKVFFAPLFLLFLMAMSTIGRTQTVTLFTDQDDYSPGEYVVITGTGWNPGDQVQLTITHIGDFIPDHTHAPWTLTADESGRLYDEWYVADIELNTTMWLQAQSLTVNSMHAETTFTDSQISSIAPTLGTSGTPFIISGVGFGGGNGVSPYVVYFVKGSDTFGPYSLDWGGTGELAGTIPSLLPGVYDIIVKNDQGNQVGQTLSNGFTYGCTPPAAPAANNYSGTYDCAEHTATANPPLGASVVYYDASSEGNVVSAPVGTNAGTDITVYAESVSEDGCVSTTRTEVTLKIEKATPTIEITWENSTYNCEANEASAKVTGACEADELSATLTYFEGVTELAGAPKDAGDYKVVASFAETDNYNATSAEKTITISKADANIVIAGWEGTFDCNAHGASITTAEGVCGDDLSAVVTLGATFTNVPGGIASWTFNGGTNYKNENGEVAITINPIQVCDNNYNGSVFVNTNSATGGSATILLSITISDALVCDQNNPPSVKFYLDADANASFSPNSPLTATAVHGSGIWTFSKSCLVTLGTGVLSTSITVNWEFSGNYSNAGCDNQNTIVTVAAPADDFAAGGGYIVLTDSKGSKAGTSGKKNNFDFNVKWGKNYSKLTGNFNTIWRQNGTSFQAKSNKPSSMMVKVVSTNPKVYYADVVYSNVNMKQLGDNASWSDGNGTIILRVYDYGEPGSKASLTPDKIGFAVKDKNGILIYSTNVYAVSANPPTTPQNLDGGNIQVKPAAATKSAEIEIAIVPEAVAPTLKAYPNPFTDRLTIEFASGEDTQARLEIYSITGAKLSTLWDAPVKAGVLYRSEYQPTLNSSQMVFYRLTMNGQTQVGKMLYKQNGY